MKRETQNLIVLMLGVAVAFMSIRGTYLNYVKTSLLPWLLVSAAALVILAVISIVRDIRRGGADADADDGHAHHGGMVWLLLLPVLLVVFVVPPPIQAGSTPQVSTIQAAKRQFPPLPEERAPTVALPEVMMRAATDEGGTLDNRLITVIGYTMRGSAGNDLARVVIICCAADAQLARIHLAGAAVDHYPENSWLQVEGTVVAGSSTAESGYVPTMKVTTATKIERPANTYAY
jgi:putative membrane protein